MPVVLMELQRETYDIKDLISEDAVGAAATKILSKAEFAPTGFQGKFIFNPQFSCSESSGSLGLSEKLHPWFWYPNQVPGYDSYQEKENAKIRLT